MRGHEQTLRVRRITTPPCRAEQVPTQALALRWREGGDRWARDALIDRFGPLAPARLVYVTSAEPLEDLVQVASVGLVAAVDRFDPNRGIPFTAFAIPTILGELKRYFRDIGWSAHVPRGAQEAALRVEEASRHLTARTGRTPNVGELAQYLELDTEQVLAGLEAGGAHFATSLDTPVAATDTEDREPLHAYVGAVDDGYALVEMTASLAAAMPRLPYLERRALTMRLRDDLKQTEIADRLGCSQMHVSRLLRRAGTRLRELTAPGTTSEPSPARPPRLRDDALRSGALARSLVRPADVRHQRRMVRQGPHRAIGADSQFGRRWSWDTATSTPRRRTETSQASAGHCVRAASLADGVFHHHKAPPRPARPPQRVRLQHRAPRARLRRPSTSSTGRGEEPPGPGPEWRPPTRAATPGRSASPTSTPESSIRSSPARPSPRRPGSFQPVDLPKSPP